MTRKRRKAKPQAQHSCMDTCKSGESQSREGPAAPTVGPRPEATMQPIVVLRRITETERGERPQMPREQQALTPYARNEPPTLKRCGNPKPVSRTSLDCVTGERRTNLYAIQSAQGGDRELPDCVPSTSRTRNCLTRTKGTRNPREKAGNEENSEANKTKLPRQRRCGKPKINSRTSLDCVTGKRQTSLDAIPSAQVGDREIPGCAPSATDCFKSQSRVKRNKATQHQKVEGGNGRKPEAKTLRPKPRGSAEPSTNSQTTLDCVHDAQGGEPTSEVRAPSMCAKGGNRVTDCDPSTHSQTTLGCATRRRRAKHDQRTRSDTDIAKPMLVRGENPAPDVVDCPVVDPLSNSLDADNVNDAARRAHPELIAPETDVEVVPVPQAELPRPDGTIRQQHEGQGGNPVPDTAQPELTEQDRETFRRLVATATSSKRRKPIGFKGMVLAADKVQRANRLLADYIRNTELGTVIQLTTVTYVAAMYITGDTKPDPKIQDVGDSGGLMRRINECRKNVEWIDQELRRQTDARTPSKKQRWIQSRLRCKANAGSLSPHQLATWREKLISLLRVLAARRRRQVQAHERRQLNRRFENEGIQALTQTTERPISLPDIKPVETLWRGVVGVEG